MRHGIDHRHRPGDRADDRVATPVDRLPRLLGRPEIGSLVGAVAVFLVFFVLAAPPFRDIDSIGTVLYQARDDRRSWPCRWRC